MRCEIVAVGTELLLGQIVDTNSSWLGEQLALAGIDCHHHVRVGDNFERIEAVLRQALGRADAVIVCGGLGPTQDDITRDVIAAVMGVPLERHEDIGERIRRRFESRGRTMPENNLRQADVPRGATTMAQFPGTAPGLVCPVGDKVLYAVPGVPYELKIMTDGTIIPDLRARAGLPTVIGSRVLRTWGQSESGLAEMLAARIDELDAIGNPTIAFLASGIEGLKVRITAKGADESGMQQILADEEALLRGILGDLVFAVDDDNMESTIISKLAERGLTLGVAESLTGGFLGARLTSVPHASEVFRGSIVSYASAVKFDLLGVTPGPVVTEQCAREMALAARRVLDADVGLGVTGVAGPDPQDGEQPGTVYLAVAVHDDVEVRRVQLPGDRERVRQYSVISILNMLRLMLDGKPPRML
ncbi:MAG: competence/damage-inducible protein A [Pseudomonadota bacterium]